VSLFGGLRASGNLEFCFERSGLDPVDQG